MDEMERMGQSVGSRDPAVTRSPRSPRIMPELRDPLDAEF